MQIQVTDNNDKAVNVRRRNVQNYPNKDCINNYSLFITNENQCVTKLFKYIGFSKNFLSYRFVFQIEYVKGWRPFLLLKAWKNQQEAPVSPQWLYDWSLMGDVHRSAVYLGFENLYFSLKSVIFVNYCIFFLIITINNS